MKRIKYRENHIEILKVTEHLCDIKECGTSAMFSMLFNWTSNRATRTKLLMCAYHYSCLLAHRLGYENDEVFELVSPKKADPDYQTDAEIDSNYNEIVFPRLSLRGNVASMKFGRGEIEFDVMRMLTRMFSLEETFYESELLIVKMFLEELGVQYKIDWES